jgi:hypothetical protein
MVKQVGYAWGHGPLTGDLPRKTLCSSGVILATVTKHVLLQHELSGHERTESEWFPESLTVRGLGRRQKLYVNTQSQ